MFGWGKAKEYVSLLRGESSSIFRQADDRIGRAENILNRLGRVKQRVGSLRPRVKNPKTGRQINNPAVRKGEEYLKKQVSAVEDLLNPNVNAGDLLTLNSRISNYNNNNAGMDLFAKYYSINGSLMGAGIGFSSAYGSEDPTMKKVLGYTIGGAMAGGYIGRSFGRSAFNSIKPDSKTIITNQAKFGVVTQKLSGIKNGLK
ncbi:hypothetical protein [Acinetobacter sp.]|uniref:hypothetical protein n=1 Tax=Acinetobacter sp. TaxID=472 RepID=UPI003CFBF868